MGLAIGAAARTGGQAVLTPARKGRALLK